MGLALGRAINKALRNKKMRSDLAQYVLIFLGAVAVAFFGVFIYRELFPEYKVYQNDYLALEKFRSSYTGEPVPEFKEGVKQIVLEREDLGPPIIDRCTSCHVALEIPYFSPTKIDYDRNGKIIRDAQGNPVQVPNDAYIWGMLDQKIAELTDAKVIEQLHSQGNASEANSRIRQADSLRALKTTQVDGHTFDATKALQMHPLIGKETRPFEFHPMQEYGCTSCHNGNGRGLTVETAHGPVFDGDYEVEFLQKPDFTEADPENDPRFARAFNAKPGAELIFQTTPIFPGALIQAKCVQCHQASKTPLLDSQNNTVSADVAALTKDYRQGEFLFISQGCYACHRITGFSRGRVGPELTKIGNSYPWYIKEHIVWPQGGLPTSTMPNYRLDHEELEDLMTYLLAQKGENSTIAKTNYKTAVQEWETGKRKPAWEQPITPAQTHDLRYAMTVFATEGCAACHRLKGFESNVGFSIEKETADFNALFQERAWFTRLFPETIIGSDLVRTIEENQIEIDQHIVDGVRKGGLLEELEASNADAVESFYTPFKYAKRAKNHDDAARFAAESNADKKRELQKEQRAWQERVHRILMVFVQEYGLGRLICPRPNWAGVYRSDEWLMEHFLNPSAHVPRSIMPVFPFDHSKFVALTYMLDTLGIRNRNAVRQIWEQRGFDPQMAVEIFCAQCHGEFLNGRGPVSEWIYPLPKNLRNADFLRNLTKERVIQSITHGVKGTPMPPWGEIGGDKAVPLHAPILTKNEIEQLAQWLFSSLSGEGVIESSSDVQKWQYTPENVLDELRRENSGEELAPPSAGIAEYFDVRAAPVAGPDQYGYYLKKKLYTEENIEAGKEFFEVNCAACHGKEADGSGERSVIMQDAKPRMLTNLDWLDTRDDLRLIRSIKFGVPGTAMTPWGDFTTALQRIQLVVYIRSLTQETQLRDRLSSALYRAFERPQWVIESARVQEYLPLDAIKTQLKQVQEQVSTLSSRAGQGEASPEDAAKLFQKELELTAQLKQRRDLDQLYLSLEEQVKREATLYNDLGQQIINKQVDEKIFDTYLTLIAQNDGRYELKEGKLVLNQNPEQEKERAALSKKVLGSLEAIIVEAESKKAQLEGQIPSAERAKALTLLSSHLNSMKQLKANVISNLEEATRAQQKQIEIYEAIDKGIGVLKSSG